MARAPKAKASRDAAPPRVVAAAEPQPVQGPERWAWLLAAPVVALAGWLALGDGIYIGNGTDLYSYQLPMRQALAAMGTSEGFPLWNPHLLGGVPTLAGLQLGLLYPPNWLSLAVAPLAGSQWQLAGHVLWLAVGGAALAKAWRPDLRRAEAAVVGALLATCGQTWGHIWAGHVSFVQAWAWLPWLWAALLQFVDTRRPIWLVAAAVALALQVLAGHPQVSFLTIFGAVAVLAIRCVAPPRALMTTATGWLDRQLATVAAVVALAAAGLGAAVLAMPQWLATAELAPALNRKLSTPLEIATAYSAPPHSLWTLVDPDRFGGPLAHGTAFSYHETVAFVGPLVVLLALWGLLVQRRRAGMVLALAVVAAVLSVGEHSPLLPALAEVVPGFGSFRVPGRWLTVVTVALLLMVVEALAGSAPPQRPRDTGAWLRLGVGILAVLHGATFAASHLGPASRAAADTLHWSDADATALTALVGPNHRIATAAALRQTNWGGAAGVRVAGGYEPAITAEANYFGNALAGRTVANYGVMFQAKRPSVWLDRMAVSHFMHDANDAAAAKAFGPWPVAATLPSGKIVRANANGMPRLHIAGRVVVQADPALAVAQLAGIAADEVVLSAALPHTTGTRSTVAVGAQTKTTVAATVHATAPVVVVLRDAWAPGWQVTVDGHPGQEARADGLFQAVAVPAGDHAILWAYRPAGWPWSLWLAAAAWAAAIGAIAVSVLAVRSQSSQQQALEIAA